MQEKEKKESSSSKRLLTNTVMLYFRMIISMVISFFSSRITLKILGVSDYGIYSVVGGLVVLFSCISVILSSSLQRFLNVEISKGDDNSEHKVFCTATVIYTVVSILIIILGEAFGSLLLSRLTIPEERFDAALWVYQCSLVSFVIGIIQIPYIAAIIAHEMMDFYAFLSIAEAILRLGSVFMLYIVAIDKLVAYALLHIVSSLLVILLYKLFCNKRIRTTVFSWPRDFSYLKPLLSFSGWSLLESVANVTSSQGCDIILNIFYGVTLNAAAAIGNQVANLIRRFSTNFQFAFRPQIVKIYVSGDREALNKMVVTASKISFYLFFFFAVPVYVFCPLLLNIWLFEVPLYAVEFTRSIVFFLLIDVIQAPLWMIIEADGRIQLYEVCVSILIALNLPFSYCLLKMGAPGYYIWFSKIIIGLFVFLFRIGYVRIKIHFPLRLYVLKVLWPIIRIVIPGFLVPLLLLRYCHNIALTILIGVFSIVLNSVLIFYGGCTQEERVLLVNMSVKKVLNRFRKV